MSTPTPQWYPGHIAKVERELSQRLKLVDVVVEVVDARLPQATLNPRLQSKIQNRPVVRLLNKADLADPVQNKRWVARFQQEDVNALLYESMQGKLKTKLIEALLQAGEPKLQSLEKKGMKRRPLRICIVGMPNVGKSSVINSIVGQKKAQTGHKAGVTREPRWVRIHPAIELLDTPGIIPPRLDSAEVGYLLAAVSSIGEAAFQDEEVALFLLQKMETLYPGLLAAHYQLPEGAAPSLETIGRSRQCLTGGGNIDHLRAAQAVLRDFRQGRWGRVTFEPC